MFRRLKGVKVFPTVTYVHNEIMADEIVALQPDVLRRILRIQAFTLIWMCAEAAVSLGAAWWARSPALLAFGGDSGIELVSALVVYWRFRFHSTEMKAEKFATRMAGGLLFALAAYVLLASAAALLGKREARSSPAGIALLLVAAVVMPWLATQKRELSAGVCVLTCFRANQKSFFSASS